MEKCARKAKRNEDREVVRQDVSRADGLLRCYAPRFLVPRSSFLLSSRPPIVRAIDIRKRDLRIDLDRPNGGAIRDARRLRPGAGEPGVDR
jgi:hypothetical protein